MRWRFPRPARRYLRYRNLRFGIHRPYGLLLARLSVSELFGGFRYFVDEGVVGFFAAGLRYVVEATIRMCGYYR